MISLTDAIDVYKMNRAYAMMAGINNVVCLYNKSGCKFTRKVCSYIIYGNHQNRVVYDIGEQDYQKTITSCWKSLTATPSVLTMSFKDFEALYDEVNKRIGKLPHIGLLTIYDAALRLGFILPKPIYPKDYVYIQAGASSGIKKLQKSKPSLFPMPITGAKRYSINLFKIAFNDLPSIFIEDFLCVYDNKFDKMDQLTRKDLLKGMEFHGTYPLIEPCYKYRF